MENKNIGAKVEVRKVLIAINPKDGWKYIKKVTGTIVENKGYEHYYHTSSGENISVYKHIIEDDYFKTYAVKLDYDLKDIEGNNIVVFREFELNFLETIIKPKKTITEKQYLNALKIIKQYKIENEL